MNNMSEPVTRAELEAVLTTFAEQITGHINSLDTKIEAVDATIERVETNLLTAFHRWARPTEIKFRASNAKVDAYGVQVTGFDERVSLLEERISELERQVRERNPPAA